MFNTFLSYLAYPFVQHALIVGVLVSLCASLLGVNLVLKRLSYIGDSLSHATFGIMIVAMMVDFVSESIFVVVVSVIVSILIHKYSSKMQGDALLTMISICGLSLGYLLMSLSNQTSNMATDVCATLFGSISILTLKQSDVYLCIFLSIIVLVIFFVLYNQLFAITFDESFSRASKVNVNAYNMLIAILLALIIVLSMNLVGSLLISGLILFPVLSAMKLCKSYMGVTITAGILSVICCLIGIVGSILAETPVGPSIILVHLICYIGFSTMRKVLG
ncbi:MAG: metal ABC transporter permease [Erysipelotrichaceae bacterium]